MTEDRTPSRWDRGRRRVFAICSCSHGAGSSVQMCPRGAETDRSWVDEQCLSCQLRFPAWPPLLMHPLTAPAPGPLCVDPAPCGLAALWPFTCDCVQSPCSPPSEPAESVPISNQLPWIRRGGVGASKTLLLQKQFLANMEKKHLKTPSKWNLVEVLQQAEDRKAAELSVISPVVTGSSVLFSLSSFGSFVGFGSSGGPRRVDPSSGGLDHTFHESQLSDGELHLLSGAGWAREKRRVELGHKITASEMMTLFTCAHNRRHLITSSIKITRIQFRNCSAGTKLLGLLYFYYNKTLSQTKKQ